MGAHDFHEAVQVLTIADTGLGPYVGLPVTCATGEGSAHLFTRETAARIAMDVSRDDMCMSVTFDADGTLRLQWSEEYDALGQLHITAPDLHGRYLLGGMWPWSLWSDKVPHADEQAAYALGAAEYQQAVTTSLPGSLHERYDQGREEAHRVTLRRNEP